MKIRTGFVSNSSSSSFIIAFPENINTVEQLKKYGDDSSIEDTCFSVNEAYEFVYENMIKMFNKDNYNFDEYENIAKYLMNKDYQRSDDVDNLIHLRIFSVNDFCEIFGISEHDSMYMSLIDIIKLAIEQENKKFNRIITVCDNDGERSDDMRWKILPSLFPGYTQQFDH